MQVAVAHQRSGQEPDSQRIWKPLQMPMTSPPAAANSFTVFMMGEKRAIEPVRR